ncbi:hypothetical protein [Streptomyces sp. NPDC003032]
MNMRKLAATGVAGAALIATTLSGGAAAANTPGSTTTTTKAVSVRAGASLDKTCLGVPNYKAKESVKLRAARKVNATAIALIPKGEWTSWCASSDYSGETYHLCGKTSNKWSYMGYKGRKGWVPSMCLV